jgi:SAM-dependent methyltransferase
VTATNPPAPVSREAITERIQRYVLDGGDEDLRRLLTIAQLTADAARVAFDRVGVQDGWAAIDCGCGPVGALPVLAQAVGANGSVVGVDFSQPSVDAARSVTASLGLDTVEVVVGDVNADASETIQPPGRSIGTTAAVDGVSAALTWPSRGLGWCILRERTSATGSSSPQLTEARVDELVSELRGAAHTGHEWVSTPFHADLALQKPAEADRGGGRGKAGDAGQPG